VLIDPQAKQKGDKPMSLPEWREFPAAPCLGKKKT
jgi:hypothetical protein